MMRLESGLFAFRQFIPNFPTRKNSGNESVILLNVSSKSYFLQYFWTIYSQFYDTTETAAARISSSQQLLTAEVHMNVKKILA